MLKKTLFILSLLLPATLLAQLGVGSWQTFPTFREIEKMVQTPNKVYCLSAGTLSSYDMDNDESTTYGVNNKLTEAHVQNIYYSRYGKYLAVAYSSGGIDILYDNGKTLNLPDIKEAILNVAPTVNDISFAPGKMIVATNFGVVIYDDKKMQVEKTGIYDMNIDRVAISPDAICLYSSATGKIYFAPASAHINVFDVFSGFSAPSANIYSINSLDGNTFIVEGNNGGRCPRLVHYDPATNAYSADSYHATKGYNGLNPSADGFYLHGSNSILQVGMDGSFTQVAIPDALKGQLFAYWDDPQTLWAGNTDGMARYSFDGSGVTQLTGRIKEDGLSCTKVGKLTFSKDGTLYVSQRGYSEVHKTDWFSGQVSYINTIKDGKITDVTGSGLTLLNTNRAGAAKGLTTDTYTVVPDPDEPGTYFVSSYYDGVFKIRDNKQVIRYGADNSSLRVYASAYRTYDIDIDKDGNLWVAIHNAAGRGLLHMLPAEKRRLDSTTEDDWVRVFFNDSERGSQDWHITVCKKSNLVLFTWKWAGRVFVVDTRGTASPEDDRTIQLGSYTDQDGRDFVTAVQEIGCLFEDSKGQIWVGYEGGIFVIPDPSKIFDSDMRVRRIKVPRNDGTGYADYLLDGENVLCMAEDSQGRKWIGTQNSGLYLVSEDGTQIIEQFYPGNSPLTTKTVYAVACDPNSNAVYVGTTDGLLKYNSTAAPAAPDYSDVYAYPNPVRPDYNGWITITGLMDNSLVKIADAAGNTFFEGLSQGGMITWDGCDAHGNRVKTGVYYVFASQGNDGGSNGAVTKILVVK